MDEAVMRGNILQILQEVRPDVVFDCDDNYIDNNYLDSFDIINLVSLLEEKYQIAIDGLEITPENFQSLKHIMRLVRKSGAAL